VRYTRYSKVLLVGIIVGRYRALYKDGNGNGKKALQIITYIHMDYYNLPWNSAIIIPTSTAQHIHDMKYPRRIHSALRVPFLPELQFVLAVQRA
jgi:hypothetical protein